MQKGITKLNLGVIKKLAEVYVLVIKFDPLPQGCFSPAIPFAIKALYTQLQLETNHNCSWFWITLFKIWICYYFILFMVENVHAFIIYNLFIICPMCLSVLTEKPL